MRMSQDTADDRNIKPSSSQAPQKQKKLPKKISERYLYNAGLYYLQRFTASKNHFIRMMMRKVKHSCSAHPDQNYQTCEEMVAKIADQFEELGYLNDTAYTRGIVTSLRRSGLSRKAILLKLRTKGITESAAKTALEHFDQEDENTAQHAELRAALTFARKKRMGPFQTTKDIPFEKALSRMARAGFDYETSRRVLEMETKDITEILD